MAYMDQPTKPITCDIAQTTAVDVQAPDAGEYSLIQAAFVWIFGAIVGGLLGFSCMMLLGSSSMHVPEHKTAPPAPGPPVPGPPVTSTASAVTQPSTAPSTGEVPVNRTVCFSNQCLRASRWIQKLLNPLADPCRSWREHVCGRFQGPQDSVRQLMDTGVRESIRKSLLAYGRNPPAVASGSADARLKAAKLLLACEATFHEFVENADVTDFMAREKLDVIVPASSSVTADELLSKHVDLAFRYALSGLMTLSPGPQMLTLDVDGSLEERITAFNAIGRSSLSEYLIDLAEFVGQKHDEAKTAVRLHNTVVTAVALIMVNTHMKSEPSTRRSTVRQLKASEVTFEGVGPSVFGDAVESKTPYSRDTDVDVSDVVLLVLEAVWKALTPAELAAWTAWAVLHECATIAVTYLSTFFDTAELKRKCALRVHHVMPEPSAAASLLDVVTKDIQDDVTEMTKVISGCLARNTSRFLRQPVLSSVIVGFPGGRDTVAGIDTHYAAFPETAKLEFFKEWVASADLRKDKLLPAEVNFDPAGTDVIASKGGIVIVPAGVFKTDLYVGGGVEALNMGGLGHVISRAIIRRFLREDVQPNAECSGPPNSDVAEDFENLLAFECAQSALRKGAVGTDAWLPMLSSLSPKRQYFTVGCFKDCRRRGTGVLGSCDTDTVRKLRSFSDAFGCSGEAPACVLP